jgi:hypothetical protein
VYTVPGCALVLVLVLVLGRGFGWALWDARRRLRGKYLGANVRE